MWKRESESDTHLEAPGSLGTGSIVADPEAVVTAPCAPDTERREKRTVLVRAWDTEVRIVTLSFS